MLKVLAGMILFPIGVVAVAFGAALVVGIIKGIAQVIKRK